MQGYIGCQVTDLDPGSSALTGLIPLEGDLVDLARYLLSTGSKLFRDSHIHQPFLTQGTALLQNFHHLSRWKVMASPSSVKMEMMKMMKMMASHCRTP